MAVVEVLRCPECNRPRNLSPEHTHRILTGRAPMTACIDCRRRPRVTLSDEERDRLEQWWLQRLPAAELVDLATGIWP